MAFPGGDLATSGEENKQIGEERAAGRLLHIVFMCVLSRETFCFPEGSDWRWQMVYRFGGKGLEKA